MNTEDLYTPLHEAVAELESRRQNAGLCAEVEDYHRDHPPVFMDGGPYACLARPIITGDNEMARFLEVSKVSGLQALGLSLSRDRFSGKNADKKNLLQLPFWKTHQERVLNIVGYWDDGVTFGDVICLNGLNLVDFHRLLLEHEYPGLGNRVRDISNWWRSVSEGHLDYVRYLTLFITHGILLENFRTDDEEEADFTRDRAIPAFLEVTGIFGVRPLIVRLFSDAEVADPKWWRYPDELYPVAKQLLHKPRKGEASPEPIPEMRNST